MLVTSCPCCGQTPLLKEWKFCPYCGTKIDLKDRDFYVDFGDDGLPEEYYLGPVLESWPPTDRKE